MRFCILEATVLAQINLNPGGLTPGGGGLVDSKCDFAFWRQLLWFKVA
jgi:hypothetical protein